MTRKPKLPPEFIEDRKQWARKSLEEIRTDILLARKEKKFRELAQLLTKEENRREIYHNEIEKEILAKEQEFQDIPDASLSEYVSQMVEAMNRDEIIELHRKLGELIDK